MVGTTLAAKASGQAGGPSLPGNAAAPAATTALKAGATLGMGGRYRVERLLGQGGFGEAYLARDTLLDRACVIKRLAIGPAWSERDRSLMQHLFAREAQLLVSLNEPGHPAIPDIYEYLSADHCLVMKYIAGQSLAALLNRRTDGLPEPEALSYVRDVCAALAYMHRRPTPVLHRDIKPANVLLGNDGRVWLIDFGLAKDMPGPGLSPPGATQGGGTIGYTPPEQWLGQAAPHSDIYALAVTLFVLLTNIQKIPVPLPPVRQINPRIRPEVEQLITAAVSEDHDKRPTTQEFLVSLDGLLREPELSPPPEPAPVPRNTGFVGRTAELAGLAHQLEDHRLATIIGLPGVGKTSLAAALARSWQSKTWDARAGQAVARGSVFWHTFHADEGIDVLIWELAGFLAHQGQGDLWRMLHQAGPGGQLPPHDLLLDYLVQAVRGLGCLLCFDDVQFIDADPLFERLIAGLRRELPAGGAIIVSSRRRPAFSADHTPPLQGLTAADTRALLESRGLTLSAELTDALYSATEGNSQFLNLAIDALRQRRDPAQLIARLADAADIERYLIREVDAQLDQDGRAVMEAVAVLLGYPGSRPTIEAVLGGVAARRTLHDLSMRHLLNISDGPQGQLYSQHAIVQSFYYQGLSRAERQRLHRRAGTHYEYDEPDALRAARHFASAGDYGRAANLASADVWGSINRGQAHALQLLLDDIAGHEQQLDTDQTVGVALARGQAYALLGESRQAQASYRVALEQLAGLPATPQVREQRARACRGLGEALEYESPQEALTWLQRGQGELGGASPVEEALLQLREGSLLIATGAYQRAQELIEQSLSRLPEQLSDWRARALVNLGVVLASQGDAARGIAAYQQALALHEQNGNFWGMIGAWQNLGIEKEIGGDWDGAAADYRRALELATQIGSVVSQAELQLSLGVLSTNRGDLDAARSYLERCYAIAEDHRLNEQTVNSLASLADLAIRQHGWNEAERLLGRAEQLALELDTRYELPGIYRGWSQVYLARSQVPAALEAAERSLELARVLEADIDEGVGLRLQGQALLAAGQPEAALAAFAQSQEILARRDPYEEARTKAAWGLALHAGDDARRVALLGAARAAFANLGARGDLEALGYG